MNSNLCIVLISLCFHASSIFAQLNESTIQKVADDLISDAYNKHLFSGVVVISHNNKVVYFKELGMANWDTKTTLTKNTLFNIGSLNKKFTEEMIGQLVTEKKLFYEDPLNKYLDMYSDEMGKKITLRQLLDMRAGLGDFLQNQQYIQDLRFRDFTLSELVEVIKTEPLLYEPGTDNRYSNSGYAVLGAVIEKITGKSYEENLRERIVIPLGITHAFYTKEDIQNQMDRAYATIVDFEGNKSDLKEVIANSTPAGGMYLDADNLLKFVNKLLCDPVSNERRGIPLFAGGSPGWSSAISFDNKEGYSTVVISNIGDDSAVEMTRRLNSAIRNEPYPPFSQPTAMTLYSMIRENGYTYIKENIRDIIDRERVPYNDRFLNNAAEKFRKANRTDIAINLYKINVELFPRSVFTYDILAQTYLHDGDKDEALTYFKKVLDLDPNNQRVIKTITDLESGKM